MKADLEELKKKFKDGRRAEAIAACEAMCAAQPELAAARQLCSTMHVLQGDFQSALPHLRACESASPGNADILFNIGLCERELKQHARAEKAFQVYVEKFPAHPDGWACLADARLQLGKFEKGLASAERALQLDPGSVPAWSARGRLEQALGRCGNAVASFTRAIELAPSQPELKLARADAYEQLGLLGDAAEDYLAGLRSSPADEPALKKATLCLLQLDRGPEAIELCKRALEANPDSIAARLGAEWLLGQMVPLWHVPMMNEEERNRPYLQALEAAVDRNKIVFEIGTGSGLLAMMAARVGAREVVTCEAVRMVAQTAVKIIERNGFAGRIRVVPKPSYQVEVGKDLPERADVLLHEVFSSELLGEHVLPAIEDAKARLLKPGGTILPGVASIMIALVGGEALGKELHVDHSFGFDLRDFNAVNPRKRPIHREDLPRVLLSDPVEAFRFDFTHQASFPPEKKRIEVRATAAGRCFGVIQWIRFEFAPGIFFENHPGQPRPVASWQHTIYRFDPPAELTEGTVIPLRAMHDRSRPWFERV